MYRFLNQDDLFFASDYQRIELGSTLNLAQTEGICVSGAASGYVSGEQIVSVLTIAPKLHSFNFSNLSNVPGVVAYPHLGTYGWGLLWKNSLVDYEYTGRIFYIYIYF